MFRSSVKALLVRCPSVQWQPDDLTIRIKKWFLGVGFLGAPPISLIRPALAEALAFKPDLVLYDAGVDVFSGDRLYIYIYIYI